MGQVGARPLRGGAGARPGGRVVTAWRRAARLLGAMVCAAAALGIAAQALGGTAAAIAAAAGERHGLLAAPAAAVLWPLAGGELLAAGHMGAAGVWLRWWPAALAGAGAMAALHMCRVGLSVWPRRARCGEQPARGSRLP